MATDAENMNFDTLTLISKDGRANIRSGNSTAYPKIGSVMPGSQFKHITTAVTLHAVLFGDKVGWVSPDSSVPPSSD